MWKRLMTTLAFVGVLGGVFAQSGTVPLEIVKAAGGRIEIRKTEFEGSTDDPDNVIINKILEKAEESPYNIEKGFFYAVVIYPEKGFAVEKVVWENENGNPKQRDLTVQNRFNSNGEFQYKFALFGYSSKTPVTSSKLIPTFVKSSVVVNFPPLERDKGSFKLFSLEDKDDKDQPKELATGDEVPQESFVKIQVTPVDKTKRPKVSYMNKTKMVSMRSLVGKSGVFEGQFNVGKDNVTLDDITFEKDNVQVVVTFPPKKLGTMVLKSKEEDKAELRELKGSEPVLRNSELSFEITTADPAKEPTLTYIYAQEQLDQEGKGKTGKEEDEKVDLPLKKGDDGIYRATLTKVLFPVSFQLKFGNEDVTNPVEETVLDNVAVFPNPFDSRFYIQAPEGEVTGYELLSLQGQLLRTGSLMGAKSVVNTEEFPLGMYLLRVKGVRGETKTFRIIKR